MTLSGKQTQAIELLTHGETVTKVAEIVGVTPQTICVWKRNDDFRETLHEIELQRFRLLVDSLHSLGESAVIELTHLMRNSKSDETKRRACMDILQMIGFASEDKGRVGWHISINSEPCP